MKAISTVLLNKIQKKIASSKSLASRLTIGNPIYKIQKKIASQEPSSTCLAPRCIDKIQKKIASLSKFQVELYRFADKLASCDTQNSKENSKLGFQPQALPLFHPWNHKIQKKIARRASKKSSGYFHRRTIQNSKENSKQILYVARTEAYLAHATQNSKENSKISSSYTFLPPLIRQPNKIQKKIASIII